MVIKNSESLKWLKAFSQGINLLPISNVYIGFGATGALKALKSKN